MIFDFSSLIMSSFSMSALLWFGISLNFFSSSFSVFGFLTGCFSNRLNLHLLPIKSYDKVSATWVCLWFIKYFCEFSGNFNFISSLCRVHLLVLCDCFHDKLPELNWNNKVHYKNMILVAYRCFRSMFDQEFYQVLWRLVSIYQCHFFLISIYHSFTNPLNGNLNSSKLIVLRMLLNLIWIYYLLLSRNNFGNACSIGLLEWREVYVGFQMQYPVYFFLAPYSGWNLPDTYCMLSYDCYFYIWLK